MFTYYSIWKIYSKLSSFNIYAVYAYIPFIRNKQMNWINVDIKKDIFEPGNVPTKRDLIDMKGKFSVGLIYQNQFFRY